MLHVEVTGKVLLYGVVECLAEFNRMLRRQYYLRDELPYLGIRTHECELQDNRIVRYGYLRRIHERGFCVLRKRYRNRLLFGFLLHEDRLDRILLKGLAQKLQEEIPSVLDIRPYECEVILPGRRGGHVAQRNAEIRKDQNKHEDKDNGPNHAVEYTTGMSLPKKKGVHPAMLHFKTVDPVLYEAALPHHELVAARPKHRRTYTKLFEALAGSIVSQQLSTKAADTIWSRLETACKGAVTPEAILKLRTLSLRKAGLSAAKVKSLKELSKAVVKGELDLLSLARIPEEEAIAKLSGIWGIGRWTAEMFLMFALEREDVFSPGDLGLRRSIEALYGLPKDCPVKELEAIALTWSPHRSFASRVLWRLRDAPLP